MDCEVLSDRAALVYPVPPYRLDLTVGVLRRRPANRVDLWHDEAYLRVLPLLGSPHLLSVRQEGPADRPLLRVVVENGRGGAEAVSQAARVVGEMLGAAVDLSAFRDLAASDPILGPLAGRLRGLKPPRFPSLWETLLNVILFQQISLTAALAISGRLVDRFGERLGHEGEVYYSYPTPEALAGADVDELRLLGLSAFKARTLKDLAVRLGTGETLLAELGAMSSPEAIGRLVQLPGVGRWSAEVILLRGLGRLDVFPGADSGVIRGLAQALSRADGLAKGEERSLAERLGPWQGMLYLLVVGFRLQQMGLLPHPEGDG